MRALRGDALGGHRLHVEAIGTQVDGRVEGRERGGGKSERSLCSRVGRQVGVHRVVLRGSARRAVSCGVAPWVEGGGVRRAGQTTGAGCPSAPPPASRCRSRTSARESRSWLARSHAQPSCAYQTWHAAVPKQLRQFGRRRDDRFGERATTVNWAQDEKVQNWSPTLHFGKADRYPTLRFAIQVLL